MKGEVSVINILVYGVTREFAALRRDLISKIKKTLGTRQLREVEIRFLQDGLERGGQTSLFVQAFGLSGMTPGLVTRVQSTIKRTIRGHFPKVHIEVDL
jgi:hypothetical protein